MLRTSLDNISEIKNEKFQSHYEGTVLTRQTYCQTSPCSVCIKIDHKAHWLLIEFTGKILMNDYPLLISKHTIRQCLENINKMNICLIDVDAILKKSEVTSCDVTSDVYCENKHELIDYVVSNLKNHKQYLCQQYYNGNLTINKNVTTKEAKKRLVIYDKEEELTKSLYKDFFEKSACQEEMVKKFRGILRFEMNLTSMQQIRKALQITTTQLDDVLSAQANPIQIFIDDILIENSIPKYIRTARDRERWEYLKSYNFDLKAIELDIRHFDKRWKRHIETYRALLKEAQKNSSPKLTKQQILDMLE